MHQGQLLLADRQARRLAESDEAYYPSIQLNTRWRVIICRDGLQWVLQYRNRAGRAETVARDGWRGRSYCRTREALIGCCDRFCGEIDPAAAAELEALPDRIEPPRDRLVDEVTIILEAATEAAETTRLLERAGSHITFPDRQWHPIGTVNIKEFDDIAGSIPDFLRRGEVRA
jgi:hypothetical protein